MADQSHTAQDIAKQAAQQPAADRAAWLDEVCSGDADLRAAVDRAMDGGPIAQAPTSLDSVGLSDASITVGLPDTIGHFSIRRIIGTGAMGTVYEAMQESPRRKVAVKVMARGATSRSAMRRFELEAQVLARLHHPGIAQIYEAGTWDDGTGAVPFFAMELIAAAKTLTEFAVDKRLDTKGKVELFMQVCDAIHHGHQKGIIHRDLKPGNILVDRRGDSKVIDFGVARTTDSDMAVTTLQTDVGALIGTLQYMSPEQCEADPDLIDIRSDIYSLGVILYELLCGKTPYDLDSIPIYDAVKIVREQTPTRLSAVNPILGGDLDTIVAKALAKDPDYRYQSALNLQQDLGRWMNGEAISARPLSLTYQISLLVRRHRAAFVAVMAIAAILVTATALSVVLAVRASDAEAIAKNELAKARVGQAFQRDILAMSSPRHAQGRHLTTQETLIEAAAGIDERFAGLPELAAETRLMVGKLMFELQMFDEAHRQLSTGITAIEALHGTEDPRVIRAMATRGRLWTEQGNADEADTLSAEALVRAHRALDADDPILFEAMAARVLSLELLTKYAEASTLGEAWLEATEACYGDRHEMSIEAKNTVGRMFMLEGFGRVSSQASQRMRDGYLLVKAAAETGRAELGPKHPVALQAQVQFAFAQWVSVFNTQESADAEQTLVDLIQDLESVLGDDHSFVLRVRHQHGRILLINGLYTRGYGDLVARGEAVLNQARDGYLRIFGSANPLTRTVDVDLSQAQARRSGTGASTEALRGAYDRLKDLYPPEHEEVVRAGSLLAAALLQDGQIEDGERLMRDALEQIEGLAGPLGTSITPLRLVLAKALIDAGRVDAGLDEANALLALVRPGFERGEMMAFGLWKSVADLYVAAGRDEDALVLFQEAAELALDHLEPTSQRRAVTLSAHAHALSLGDQPSSALAVIDPAIATATVVTMDSAAIQDGEEVWNPTAAPTMHLVRVEALLLLERDEDAQAAFTTLLETHARPRALLWVIQATVALNSPDLIKTFGDALLAAALTARDELEPDGNADLVWRDAVIAKLHSARGDFAFAVQWQAQAVEAADADHLNDAKRTLEAYRAALEAANESTSGP